MKRILFVIPTLDRSGAEKQLSLLAAHLPRDEFDVRVVCLTRGGPYEEPIRLAGIPIDILGKRWKFDPRTLMQLRQRVNQWRPDIVSTWLFAANSYGRLAMMGLKQRPLTVVAERCVDSWKAGWQLALDRQLVSSTDALVANSESVADFYSRQGFPQQKIKVIPNGVDIPSWPGISREDLLAQLGLPADALLAGFIGRLAPQKRLKDLLWGMQILRQAEPRARLLLIGDGPQRSELEMHARQVEVADFVRFLGHREDASALLHFLDAFWLGSEFEGMSNSLMEAMACGKPVIVSSIPPNRELVRHGETGWLVETGDAVGFAQFTLKVWREHEQSREMSNRAAARMQSSFSIPVMVDRFAALFRELGHCRVPGEDVI